MQGLGGGKLNTRIKLHLMKHFTPSQSCTIQSSVTMNALAKLTEIHVKKKMNLKVLGARYLQITISKYKIIKTRIFSIDKNRRLCMMMLSLTYGHNPDKRYENPDNCGAP